jgi:hypothetical protein
MSDDGIGRLDLTIKRGDLYPHQLEFVTRAADGTITPIDVSDRVYTAQIRERQASATAVAFTIDTSQADNGIILLTLTGDQTRALPAIAVWDLQEVIPPETDPVTLLAGSVTVKGDVTR